MNVKKLFVNWRPFCFGPIGQTSPEGSTISPTCSSSNGSLGNVGGHSKAILSKEARIVLKHATKKSN